MLRSSAETPESIAERAVELAHKVAELEGRLEEAKEELRASAKRLGWSEVVTSKGPVKVVQVTPSIVRAEQSKGKLVDLSSAKASLPEAAYKLFFKEKMVVEIADADIDRHNLRLSTLSRAAEEYIQTLLVVGTPLARVTFPKRETP